MIVDLLFPITGGPLQVDHAYPLLGGLSRIVPAFHEDNGPRFLPITGEPLGDAKLAITPNSRLRVRVADSAIRTLLPLAGKRLELDGHHVRLGVPTLQTPAPAASLFSRLVVIHQKENPKVELPAFLDAARRQLAEQGIEGEPSAPIWMDGERAGQPMRRVVRIHDVIVPGYALLVEGLSAEHSWKLQEHGLGGRLRMGCGFFVPARGSNT